MFECTACGSTEGREALVTEVFEIDSRRVLVENIPAMVCVCCGEPVFSCETTEKVRQVIDNNVEKVWT